MSDEEIIKRRLVFDGDGTGEDRRLNVFMRLITKWVTDDDTPAESQTMYDKITSQLSLIEYSRKRSSYIHKTTEEELSKYQNMHAEYENRIEETRIEIEKQRKLLEQAKVTKQNRIQYDLLAKAISKEPARKKMNDRLEKLQTELTELAEEKTQLDKKLDTTKKQFYVLSTSANALKHVLDKENESKASVNNDTVDTNSRGPSVEPMSE